MHTYMSDDNALKQRLRKGCSYDMYHSYAIKTSCNFQGRSVLQSTSTQIFTTKHFADNILLYVTQIAQASMFTKSQ